MHDGFESLAPILPEFAHFHCFKSFSDFSNTIFFLSAFIAGSLKLFLIVFFEFGFFFHQHFFPFLINLTNFRTPEKITYTLKKRRAPPIFVCSNENARNFQLNNRDATKKKTNYVPDALLLLTRTMYY